MLRRFVCPSACALMTSLPVLNNCSILDARRTLIHKSVTRKLQKGKQLRKSSPTATVQASTKSLNAASKRSSAALKAKEGKPSKHAPRKTSVTTTPPPATLKYDHDEYADDCTAEEVQFANTEQVVGIFRRSYEAPDADQLEARILHQTDAYGGTSMRDGESSSTLSASQRRQRLRSIQLRNINHVAVPPVEVPTVHQRRGGAFLPRELLRRVMREEAGTSVSSRFVSQSCLVRQRPQTVVSPSPRPQVLKPTTSHIKIHVSTAGGSITNAPTAQSLNSTTPSHDAQTSTTKNHHPQQSITPMELHEAALVGDAALLMEETANLMPSVLSQAISDDRTSTSIEEAGEDGSVKMPQDDRASTLEHIKGTPVDLTTPNTTTSKSLGNRRDEPSSRIGADADDLDAANQADDDVTTMCPEEGDHTSMNESEEDENLTAEEEKALLPWANGTLIPLSSNYITRSERQDPFFAPFTPLPTAKRIAVVQQEPLMTRMPPLSGVAMYGTVVAVKVLHNTRESLELAAASSKRQVGGESTTPHPATSKIVLDRYAPDHMPRIVVHIMDDEDNVDMGKFLFEL